MAKAFWKCLQYCEKCFGNLFGVCGHSRKSRGVCLGVRGYSRKSCGKCWGVCGSTASLAANAGAFAGTPASLAANAGAFAGVPQVSRQMLGRSRESRKHFQRHFGRYSALSKTFSRDKDLHSFVELTFFQLSVGPVGSIVLHRQGLSACKTSISKKQGLPRQAYTEATSQQGGSTNTSKSHDI